MKKNLFLTCALALASFVGVSAQWSHTVTSGLPGTDVTTTLEDGTQVTNRYAETKVFSRTGTSSIRMTVLMTGSTNQIKGGGPTWNLAELKIYDGNGKEIAYTATSNADHNTMGQAGEDGAGLPALNDGKLNNYWHSTWSASAPNEYHYLEFQLAETVDAFKLAWWNRPNNNNNCPIVVGLTPGGVAFTEDMKFAEYGFELGEKVTSADELTAGTYAFYVEGPTEDPNGSDNTGPGNVFVALSGYNTGNAQTAGPEHIVQFIPTGDGKFVLYQPLADTYYAQPDRWADYNEGKNGWQRAYGEARVLGEFEFTERADGDFEMTTYSHYVKNAEGNLEERDTPVKLWVGYDMRGNLKVFPEPVKIGLENGDYSLGFGLPVDFGFTIYKAGVADGVIVNKTAAEMCEEILGSTLDVVDEKMEEYADLIDEWDWDGAIDLVNDALGNAELAIEQGDLAAAFAAKEELEKSLACLLAIKVNYYDEELLPAMQDEYDNNHANPPYKPSDTGKYPGTAQNILDQIKQIYKDVAANVSVDGDVNYTYSQVAEKWAQIETLIEKFYASALSFSEFPVKIEGAANVLTNKHRVHESNVVNLVANVNGIRLTFTATNSTHMNDGYPQVVLAEFELFDAKGEQVDLSVSNFATNSIQENEGALSNICNGIIEAEEGVTEGTCEYWHSIWNGAAHNPSGHVYLDVTFPEPMSSFSFKFTGRNIDGGRDQQFPTAYVLTEVGNAYDPLLFAENPYNVYVGEKVKNVSEITADGFYVIKGLLNTQPVYNVDEETGLIVLDDEPAGTAKFYHGIDRFHQAAAAVRADGVYRFVPNADGTFKVLSLGLAKYWPSTDATGFVSDNGGAVYSAENAANLKIEASTNAPESFVMYEYHEGLQTKDSIDVDGKKVEKVYDTPYVVFMDWANTLATRPVKDWKPFKDANTADRWGDSLCFNKSNGEAEWEIYKVTMDNPDFFWLTNMTGALDELGLIVGTDPGCISGLGGFEAALEDGLRVVEGSLYNEATTVANALAKEIGALETIEKNPMVPGVYQLVSALGEFKNRQGVEKALYATVDEAGTSTFGWKDIEENNTQFYFDFQPSIEAEDLYAGGKITEEQKDLLYTIRAIDTYEGATPYYVGKANDRSVEILLGGDAPESYLVLEAAGSAFNLAYYKNVDQFCIHTNGHSDGAGQSGNIVYWNGTADASQWYLRKVDYQTSIDDLVTEGTEVVSVAYYTTAGTAVPAPVKGINIVVTTYANGVVEAKKVLVK